MHTLRTIARAIGYAITATLCLAAFWLLLIVTP
jgi:hypothetical protein